MPQKHHTVDQIVAKLRKADVELGKVMKSPNSVEAMGNQLSALNEQHGFWSNGNYHTNCLGHQTRWIRDESGQWHFLLPEGGLYRWQTSFAGSTLIAKARQCRVRRPIPLDRSARGRARRHAQWQ